MTSWRSVGPTGFTSPVPSGPRSDTFETRVLTDGCPGVSEGVRSPVAGPEWTVDRRVSRSGVVSPRGALCVGSRTTKTGEE